MLLSLKPGGIIVFSAKYSYIGKYYQEAILKEHEESQRLDFVTSDLFFKFDKLSEVVAKFRKTPVKTYVYQKKERDSVLGYRKQKSMTQKEIEAVMSKGVMKMMQKQMSNLQLTEKISGIASK